MTAPTNRESDRFMLRLPDGMRDRIKAAAAESNRSMNAEIVATLEKEYPAPLSFDQEKLLVLMAAALFNPSRADGQFTKIYNKLVRYAEAELGISDIDRPLPDLRSIQQGSAPIDIDTFQDWMQNKFHPWMPASEDD